MPPRSSDLRRLLLSRAARRHRHAGVLFAPDGFRFDHLEVAKRVFTGLKCGAFVELDVRAVDVVRLGFAGATRTPVGSR
jgi:hypothetical protein